MYEVEDEGGYHFLKTHRKIRCLIPYDGGFVVVEGEGWERRWLGEEGRRKAHCHSLVWWLVNVGGGDMVGVGCERDEMWCGWGEWGVREMRCGVGGCRGVYGVRAIRSHGRL